jgi:hypothetical protein
LRLLMLNHALARAVAPPFLARTHLRILLSSAYPRPKVRFWWHVVPYIDLGGKLVVD